jgi:Uri superfamily endonuclease
MKTVVCGRRAAVKGVYVLVILVSKNISVKVGGLKGFTLNNGFYAYVGSAQKYLDKRLMRHFSKAGKKRFWHIDYLVAMDCVSVVKVFYKEAGKQEECETAQYFSTVGFPVGGFGCSDCKCKSHLFRFESLKPLEDACIKLGFKQFSPS